MLQDRKRLNEEDWFNKNEHSIMTEIMESGVYREMDYDLEKEIEKRYEKYLESLN